MNTFPRRAAASVFVLLMVLAPFVACASAADAMGDETYTIDMRTGDLFSYTPRTNMESEIGVTPLNGLTWDSGTVTASFGSVDTTGGLVTVIGASWTSEDGNVTQRISQTIVFRVHPHVTMDGAGSGSVTAIVSPDAEVGTVVYRPVVSESSEGTVTSVTCEGGNGYLAWDPLAKAVVVSGAIPSDSVGAETSFTLTAVNSPISSDITLAPETATRDVTVRVGDVIEITSPDMVEMNVTDVSGAYVVTVDTAEGVTVDSISVEPKGDVPEGFIRSVEDGEVTFDPSVVDTGSRRYVDIPLTVTVDGTLSGEPVRTAKDITVRVWKDSSHGQVPSFDRVTAVPSAGSGLTVTVSSMVSGAETVTVHWGDGTMTSGGSGVSELYNATHTYTADGSYVIRVVAGNVNGEVTSYILYDTVTGESEPTGPGGGVSGNLGLYMTIAAIVMWAAYFFVRPTSGTLLASIVVTIASVILCAVVR